MILNAAVLLVQAQLNHKPTIPEINAAKFNFSKSGLLFFIFVTDIFSQDEIKSINFDIHLTGLIYIYTYWWFLGLGLCMLLGGYTI